MSKEGTTMLGKEIGTCQPDFEGGEQGFIVAPPPGLESLPGYGRLRSHR